MGYDTAAKLFMRIMQEDRRRKWTQKAMNKIVIVFENMAKVKPTSSDVRTYCDLFLVQFSNIAMRGEMKEMSLKPLIAMVLTENRHIREASAIDVVRHLANFFDSTIAAEAQSQLHHLEEIIARTRDKEIMLKSLPTAALERLKASGLNREDYIIITQNMVIQLIIGKKKIQRRFMHLNKEFLKKKRNVVLMFLLVKEEKKKLLFLLKFL